MNEKIRTNHGDLTVHALKHGYVERNVWDVASTGSRYSLSMSWNQSEKAYVITLYELLWPNGPSGVAVRKLIWQDVRNTLHAARTSFRHTRQKYS